LDPTTSSLFRRTCDILEKYILYIPAGGTEILELNQYYPEGRIMTTDVEGSSQVRGYKGMQGLYLLRATVPVTDINDLGTTPDTGSFNATISWVWTRYCTYYNIEDNEPSSASQVTNTPISSTIVYAVPPTQRGADLHMTGEGTYIPNVRQPPVLTDET
jgi:hypothetical protein